MKKLVELCLCDVCNKETDKRYKMSLSLGSWNDDNYSENEVHKDLCEDCYSAFLGLTHMDRKEEIKEEVEIEIKEESKPKQKFDPRSHIHGKRYTEEEILEFERYYLLGLTNQEISDKMGISFNQVVHLCVRTKANGLKRGSMKEKVTEEKRDNSFRVVVDSDGFVQEIGA